MPAVTVLYPLVLSTVALLTAGIIDFLLVLNKHKKLVRKEFPDPSGTIEKDYDKFHMILKCYYAYVESGNMILKEHLGARWLTKDELESVDWVSADATLLEHIKSDMADAQP